MKSGKKCANPERDLASPKTISQKAAAFAWQKFLVVM